MGWRGWWCGLLLLCWPLCAWPANPALRVVQLQAAPAAMPDPSAAMPAGRVTHTGAWLGQPRTPQLWYALSLTRNWDAASRPLLVIEGNVLNRITVYLPPDYAPRVDTIFDAALDPAFSHHAVVYRLPVGLRAEQPVYVEFSGLRQKAPVWFGIVDAAGYRAADLNYVRANTFFTTVQISMVLAVLCFFVVLRDRVLLYFVVYASALVVYGLAMSGELYAMSGTAFLGVFGNRTPLGMAALAAAFLIWFTLDFAKLRRHTPRLAAWLGVARWLFLVLAVVMWLPGLFVSKWPARIMDGLILPTAPLLLVASWLAWRRGNRQGAFFLLSWAPLLLMTVLRTAQLFTRLPLPDWLEYGFPASMALAAVGITVGLADRLLQARHERDTATRLAQSDPLTGVLNRRAVMEQLHAAWNAAPDSAAPLAVLFLDLDHFKQINDGFGHAAGDACLAALPGAVRAELGEADFVGRYGGEEFVVVLRDASARVAAAVARRIVARIAALEVPVADHTHRLTVSIGVAVRDAVMPSPEALVECADAAQYRAKAEGRNRVIEYSRDLPLRAVAG